MGWNKWQKRDKNKTQQLLLYKQFYSQQYNHPVDKIEVEYFIVKRKLFEKSDLKLEYQEYHHPKYPQRFANEFIPDLSIIDMLSNIGPDTIKVLKGQISFN